MVYFSVQAEQDLSDIIIGLLLWTKASISEEQAFQYADDIYLMGHTIADLAHHQKCTYAMHRQYGEYLLKYRRNNRTTWYIIYNIAATNDIYIEKIISNYLTVN